MERFCGQCGSLIGGNANFCPICGAPLKSAVDLGKRGDAPRNFRSGNIPVSGSSPPQYGRSYNPYDPHAVPPTEKLNAGQWIGTFIICTCLGIISLVINIIWGYCSDMPEPRRSFARGMLWVSIAGIVLGGVFWGVARWIGGSPF